MLLSPAKKRHTHAHSCPGIILLVVSQKYIHQIKKSSMDVAISLAALNTYATIGHEGVPMILSVRQPMNSELQLEGGSGISSNRFSQSNMSRKEKPKEKPKEDNSEFVKQIEVNQSAKGRFSYKNFITMDVNAVGLMPGYEVFKATAMVCTDGAEEGDNAQEGDKEKHFFLVRMPPTCLEEVRANWCL